MKRCPDFSRKVWSILQMEAIFTNLVRRGDYWARIRLITSSNCEALSSGAPDLSHPLSALTRKCSSLTATLGKTIRVLTEVFASSSSASTIRRFRSLMGASTSQLEPDFVGQHLASTTEINCPVLR